MLTRWIASIKPRWMNSAATLFFLLSMDILFVATCQSGNPLKPILRKPSFLPSLLD
jgi:hypothetical protein